MAYIRRTGTQNKIREQLVADKPCWTKTHPWRSQWELYAK